MNNLPAQPAYFDPERSEPLNIFIAPPMVSMNECVIFCWCDVSIYRLILFKLNFERLCKDGKSLIYLYGIYRDFK